MKSLLLALIVFVGCTKKTDLGSKNNPVKFFLVPGQELSILQETSTELKSFLEKDTGLAFEINIPNSYISVVEAFGTKRADIAIINTFGFLLAKKKYQVHARLRTINNGNDQYYGQIIVRSDGPVKLSDLNGKKMAYVDPASTSGYLLPASLFKKLNIELKEFIFSGRHDVVVSQVYQRQVDAGATFYLPDQQDARKLVKTQYPDVFRKIKILEKTGPIPNDPVIFRKDFPIHLEDKIVTSLKNFIKTNEGKQTLIKLFNVTDFAETNNSAYNEIDKVIQQVSTM